MGRRLKLDDQGNLQFFEAVANGTNKVTVQSPASLAADYTLTLPVDDGTANQFLQTDGAGVLSWANSTATLQAAYDNGTKIDADGTEVEIEVAAAQGNVALLLDQDDNQHALSVTKDGTGAGSGVNVVNAGTGDSLAVQQTSTGRGLFINQDGDASAISVDVVGTNTTDAITILNAGTGKGMFLDQDGAAIALDIDQDGSAIALQVNQATANNAINVTCGAADGIVVGQANNNRAVEITKTGTGAGSAFYVENDGTGRGFELVQDGVGKALHVTQNTTEDACRLIQNANGLGFYVEQNGDGVALTASSAAGTSDCFEAEVLSPGTGRGILVDHDGNGIAIDIDSEATGQPLINLAPIDGNSRGDIAFGTARTSDPSSPSEGDIWYDSTEKRLSLEFSGGITKEFAHLLGPSFGRASTPITIATGVVSATAGTAGGTLVLAAESGTSDDLDTLTAETNMDEGYTLILRADAGDTITVKHNTGNIHLDGSADKALTNGNQLMLVYDGTDWLQLTPMMVLP